MRSQAQTILTIAVGIIVGLAMAFCFLRVARDAFQIIAVLFWIGVGIVLVRLIFAYVRRRLG